MRIILLEYRHTYGYVDVVLLVLLVVRLGPHTLNSSFSSPSPFPLPSLAFRFLSLSINQLTSQNIFDEHTTFSNDVSKTKIYFIMSIHSFIIILVNNCMIYYLNIKSVFSKLYRRLFTLYFIPLSKKLINFLKY